MTLFSQELDKRSLAFRTLLLNYPQLHKQRYPAVKIWNASRSTWNIVIANKVYLPYQKGVISLAKLITHYSGSILQSDNKYGSSLLSVVPKCLRLLTIQATSKSTWFMNFVEFHLFNYVFLSVCWFICDWDYIFQISEFRVYHFCGENGGEYILKLKEYSKCSTGIRYVNYGEFMSNGITMII